MTIADQKAAARKEAFAARKIGFQSGVDQAANDHLLEALKTADKSKIIAGYMPIRTELSPIATMTEMSREGFKICVPVVLGAGKPLEFREWHPDTEMQEGAFGAKIPVNSDVLIPDIIISPLVAFDLDGYRLGYGGGFYDRSFEEITQDKPVRAIGFAYAEQQIAAVPREPTDYQLDAIITQNGLLSFG